MTVPTNAPDPQSVTATQPTGHVHLFKRILRNPLGLIPLIFLVLVVLAAILAPLLASTDGNTAVISDVLAPPGSPGHPLGADGAGRDVWSRLLYAARNSLLGALVALCTAMLIGVTGGLVAGYFGKWIDAAWTWVISLLMALPNIIVLLAARSVIGPSLWLAMVIFGILLSPAFFRLVYASVSAVRNELYVDAARVSGLSDARIISRHILTVVRAPIVIQAAIVGGIALAIQSGLEFLGLGDINVPTWGAMLSDGFTNLYTVPTLIIWPALAIGLTLLSLTLLANTLRDELERAGSPSKRRRTNKSTSNENRVDDDTIRHDAPAADDLVLQISNLAVAYPAPGGGQKQVVHDVSLTVAKGEVHGLVGESGSGKTQTAWSVLRLLPEGGQIVAGSILFQGDDLATLPVGKMTKLRGRRIGYIPQEPMSNLDPAFTIGHQLVEPMRICLDLSRAQAKKRALELLARVGIPNPDRTFASYPHQVSGGMAQRVLIAGAISCNPDLLIADEPTTALDVTVQAEVLDLLRDLQSEYRMAVIMVTHNFGVVADLCDRVSVMQLGRIVETGPVRSIFSDPRHPYTQQLLGSILSDAEPRGALAPVGDGTAEPDGDDDAEPEPAATLRKEVLL